MFMQLPLEVKFLIISELLDTGSIQDILRARLVNCAVNPNIFHLQILNTVKTNTRFQLFSQKRSKRT